MWLNNKILVLKQLSVLETYVEFNDITWVHNGVGYGRPRLYKYLVPEYCAVVQSIPFCVKYAESGRFCVEAIDLFIV